MEIVEVPQTLKYRGGQLNAAPILEVENFTNWKKVVPVPYHWKPEGLWTRDERKAANLDQRIKSLIMSVLSDDHMNYVINCLTAKSTWDDLILYHKGPSDVKESRVMDLKTKYKAKIGSLSSRLHLPKHQQLKNKDDNEMVEVKVRMALAEENDVVSKEKRILGVNQLTEDPSISRKKDLVFVKSSAGDTKVSIPGVERPWLSEAEGFILPNHDTGRILPPESQRKTTDPSVAVIDSSTTEYDSADESLVCSTPLPSLKKLDGAEPISRPKTIKSILRSKSTFKAKTLKGVKINEPSLAPAKGNKSCSTSKVNSARAGKLKNVKIEDDPPLAIVIKELNDLKL
ncbi:hypothetical protein Tco_0316803 [Tanacetum coccineum]